MYHRCYEGTCFSLAYLGSVRIDLAADRRYAMSLWLIISRQRVYCFVVSTVTPTPRIRPF